MADVMPGFKSTQVASRLIRAEMRPIGKQREQLAQFRIWDFWLVAQKQAKVARVVSHVIDARKDVQEMTFRDLGIHGTPFSQPHLPARRLKPGHLV